MAVGGGAMRGREGGAESGVQRKRRKQEGEGGDAAGQRVVTAVAKLRKRRAHGRSRSQFAHTRNCCRRACGRAAAERRSRMTVLAGAPLRLGRRPAHVPAAGEIRRAQESAARVSRGRQTAVQKSA